MDVVYVLSSIVHLLICSGWKSQGVLQVLHAEHLTLIADIEFLTEKKVPLHVIRIAALNGPWNALSFYPFKSYFRKQFQTVFR